MSGASRKRKKAAKASALVSHYRAKFLEAEKDRLAIALSNLATLGFIEPNRAVQILESLGISPRFFDLLDFEAHCECDKYSILLWQIGFKARYGKHDDTLPSCKNFNPFGR